MKILNAAFLFIMLLIATHAIAVEPIFMDSKKPLQILSKTLRYIPGDEKAIFEGNVDAVQEKNKLSCDSMIVEFEKDEQGLEPVLNDNQDKNSPALNSKQKKIKKIYAKGNVVMHNTVNDEKIEALRAEYEPKFSQIIFYDDVKITKGKAIPDATQIMGAKLVYNTNTGESIMEAVANERVKGRFITEKEKNND